ncbi:hypothetical protein PR202_gb13581 [Eleusine coracana subsp. coracana]|uniref:Protein FRA10AC1 n=1 Tax=Eleusine coracana subsp. coracana TaxID=191504 RepID=A0AAV5ETK9_ELECO|nr:hypothetical protein PR202_gb13581 [Eleusine coracana subsp. coracana]
MASLGRLKSAIFDKEERKMQYQSHIRGLNAYDRHKKFMKDYVQFYGHGKTEEHNLPIKTDIDTLREGYRFILSDEDDMDSTWEKRLVKRQFICGNRHCDEKHGLGSYEVNFSYVEAGEQKQALVKLVACKSLLFSLIVVHYERCAEKLAYKRQKEKEKEEKEREKEHAAEKEIELKGSTKRKREHEESDTSEDEDESTEKNSRKRKDGKGTSSRNLSNNDEGFEEFLEGMFP